MRMKSRLSTLASCLSSVQFGGSWDEAALGYSGIHRIGAWPSPAALYPPQLTQRSHGMWAFFVFCVLMSHLSSKMETLIFPPAKSA